MDIIYCHNTMAKRGSLKQTKNSRHVEAKIDQKEKKNFKTKRKSLENLPLFRKCAQEVEDERSTEEALQTTA